MDPRSPRARSPCDFPFEDPPEAEGGKTKRSPKSQLQKGSSRPSLGLAAMIYLQFKLHPNRMLSIPFLDVCCYHDEASNHLIPWRMSKFRLDWVSQDSSQVVAVVVSAVHFFLKNMIARAKLAVVFRSRFSARRRRYWWRRSITNLPA